MWRLHGRSFEGAQGIMMNATGLRLCFLGSMSVNSSHSMPNNVFMCSSGMSVFFFFPPHMWPSLIHSALNWRHCLVGFLLQRVIHYMPLFDMKTEALLIQLNRCMYIIGVIKKKLKWWVTRAIGRLASSPCHKPLLMLTQQKHSVAE